MRFINVRLFCFSVHSFAYVLLFKGGCVMFWRAIGKILITLLANLVVELVLAAILA